MSVYVIAQWHAAKKDQKTNSICLWPANNRREAKDQTAESGKANEDKNETQNIYLADLGCTFSNHLCAGALPILWFLHIWPRWNKVDDWNKVDAIQGSKYKVRWQKHTF